MENARRILIHARSDDELHGMARFFRQHPQYEVSRHRKEQIAQEQIRRVAERPLGGFVGLIGREYQKQLHKHDVACVLTNDDHFEPGSYVVGPDDEKIGQLAAAHLIQRGFRLFGYVGLDLAGLRAGATRRKGFENEIRSIQAEPMHFCSGPFLDPARFEQTQRTLQQWAASLPKPAGVLAFNDRLAVLLVLAARQAGLEVPRDLAVLGVDNDLADVEFANPPLTSVDPGFERIGYLAAATLHRVLSGSRTPREIRYVEPVGVIIRESTDTFATQDEDVLRALEFIRREISEPIGAEDVAAAAICSRRNLDRKFRQALGRTVEAEIWRSRTEQASRLLLDTDHVIAEIASRCGFATIHHFSRRFRQATGYSPTAYRRGRK